MRPALNMTPGETAAGTPTIAPKWRSRPFTWPDAVWVDLVISLFIGLTYLLLVAGPRVLNVRDTSWLLYDGSTYFIGWGLFRQDPFLHFPLTFTQRIGYPIGDSVAFLDVDPLLALVFKPFSALLPWPFQYLGIEMALECGLQFFFAVRLFRQLLKTRSPIVFLPSIFFLIAPPFSLRLGAHFALANHWLLLASLLLFFRTALVQDSSLRWFVGCSVLLVLLAAATNPYLMCFVLAVMATAIASLLWQRRIRWPAAGAVMLGLTAACAAALLFIGLPLGGFSSVGNTGYRSYSMNLIAPVDPYPFTSVLLPRVLPKTDAQLDGYNYFGLGVLVLSWVLIPFLWSRRRILRRRAPQFVPLAVCCFLLTIWAASTEITLGPRVLVDLDPQQHLTKFFSPLRATGRFFWVPFYTTLVCILAATFRMLRPQLSVVLVTAALAIQIADTASLRAWMKEQTSLNFHPTPLKSAVWSELGTQHRNLIVLPAWQCDDVNTPGGFDGFRIFGFLAVQQRMRTNSYYSARYSKASLQFHCSDAPAELRKHALARDSAYVVNPAMAALIALGPSGPQSCHTVDGFILCSSATDFGLPSSTASYLPRLNEANRFAARAEAKAANFLPSGWYIEPGAPWIWSNGDAVFEFALSPQQRSRFRRVVLHVRVLVGHQDVKFSVRQAGSEVDGTAVAAPQAAIRELKVSVPLREGTAQFFEIATENPPRPVDLGINSDSRRIGAGLEEAWLEP